MSATRRAGLLAVAAVLALGRVGTADLAPPAGTKLVPVTGTVEAAEAFPDYRFFLADAATYHGPPRPGVKDRDETHQWRSDTVVSETRLEPGSPVTATGGRRSTVSLYAVPRVAAADRSPEDLVGAVDRGEIRGATHQGIGSATTIPQSDPRAVVVVPYRLERSASGDGLVFRRLDEPGPAGAGSDPPVGAEESVVRWTIAGIAAAVAVCGLGLWLVTRKRGPNPSG